MEYVLYQSTRVKARKAWTCDDCGGPITKGEIYERDIMWCAFGGHCALRYCSHHFCPARLTAPFDYLLGKTDRC